MRTISNSVLDTRVLLKNYSIEKLSELLHSWGIQRFRAKQIYQGVYAESVSSLAEIETLPLTLRAELNAKFFFSSLKLERKQVSEDGTIKFLFSLVDGAKIESVLIPSELVVADGTPKRLTLCISTQAGCPLGCVFCATASLKLRRNLECAEIVDQLLEVQKYSQLPVTNIVFMGMGEPLLNYDNVMSAVQIFTDPQTKLLVPKRITLSTAGVVPGIQKMADDKSAIKLAISLHATTNGLRQKLMPIARKYSLEDLGNALEYYYRSTKIPVTFEYILFEGVNDSPNDVKRLARFTRRVPSKVNVIPFHSIEFTHPDGLASTLKPSSTQRFQTFIQELQSEKVRVMVRSSSGLDIDAACGQLALANSEDFTPSDSLNN